MAPHNSTAHIEQPNQDGRRRSSVVAAPPLPSNTLGTNDEVLRRMSVTMPDLVRITEDAKNAIDLEHDMSVMEAVKLYPKSVVYSMILSLTIIMEGYDTALLGNFYGLPQFNEKFGVQLADGSYSLTSSWQSGLQNGANVGEICGLMLAGILADRFGYKPTLIGALIMVIGCIFLMFFAKNIGMLFAAEILCGIPWGAFQTLSTTYAADVTPIRLRPILTTYVNMCWVVGQLIATGILRGLLTRSDQWAWRIPYAIQWVWPVPIIVGIVFAPESPWWLVRKGRVGDARASLRRLTSSAFTEEHLDNTLTMMTFTNEQEKQVNSGTTYWDCFKGTNLRRTEIACIVWCIQVFCGIWFGGNITYFLEQAGFNPAKAFDFGLGTACLGFVSTIGAWFLMAHVGRRKLYLIGLTTMFTVLMLVGFMGIPAKKAVLAWVSGGFLVIFVVTYSLTVGPVCYCLVSEIASTRLRIKTTVLARNAYNIASIIANFLSPPILNPTAWNLRGKGGFIWASFCFSSLVWTFFRLPEPKGLSAAELDLLFEHKVSARKFKKTAADPFRSANFEVKELVESETEDANQKFG